MIDKVIITKVARIVSVMFLRKIKKPISMFEVFSLVLFFFLSQFFCIYLFSFVILTIIRTRKRQRTYFNNVSNINKIITMTSWRNRDIMPLNFPKII